MNLILGHLDLKVRVSFLKCNNLRKTAKMPDLSKEFNHFISHSFVVNIVGNEI